MTRTTKTREPVPLERRKAINDALDFIVKHVPEGAARIEVDIEWTDGGRVKVEVKA